MMRSTLLLIPLLLLSLMGAAQGFVIDTFHVRIDLSRDGYFDVTENIHVNFSESKHGIFRQIPFKYAWNDSISGAKATNRGAKGTVYQTPIVNLEVPGFEHATEVEGDFIKVRIGNSGTYVNGKVVYTIRYRVYGAINQFADHDELYWNFTGNGWKVNIEYSSFEIHLPSPLSLAASNARTWTGALGSTTSGAVLNMEEKILKGHCPSRLLPGHGITLGFSMPTGYLDIQPIPSSALATDYSINDWQSTWSLQQDGTWLVTEAFDINIVNSSTEFIRKLPGEINEELKAKTGIRFASTPAYEFLSVRVTGPQKDTLFAYRSGGIDLPQYKFPFVNRAGQLQFVMQYRVWNSLAQEATGTTLFWEPTGVLMPEPADHAVFRIELPESLTKADVWEFHRSVGGNVKFAARQGVQVIEVTADNIRPYELIYGYIRLANPTLKTVAAPPHILCGEYYFPHYNITTRVKTNGTVELDYDFNLMHVGLLGTYLQWVKTDFASNSSPFCTLPDYGPLRRKNELNYSPLTSADPSMLTDHVWDSEQLTWTLSSMDHGKPKACHSSISFFDLLTRDGSGNWSLNFPIGQALDEPADTFNFRLEVEGLAAEALKAVKAEIVFYDADTAVSTHPLSAAGNALVSGPLVHWGKHGAAIRATLPAAAVHKPFASQMGLYFRHNLFLILPFIALLILFPLWFFLGRDKNHVKVVQFYPPEGMTPTEAGLLVDDKLHNRDLLALIYYWAFNGNLRIETTNSDSKTPSITLYKLKALPKDAKPFERTLFDGLFKSSFKGEPKVALSTLKYTFYERMAKARKEVEAYARQKNFYVPGTRAFSGWVRFFAGVSLLLSLITAGCLFMHFRVVEPGRWEVPLGYAGLWFVLRFFGRRMVKRGPFGSRQYAALDGFREFIVKADKDRLAKLLDTDAMYYEHTLSFAIAMGLANKWTEKFDDLLSTPPDWYQTDSKSTGFNSTLLNQQLSSMLWTMDSQLNSTPPKTSSSSGSTWGGGSSGSSSSSSSSSYSGGGGSYSSSGGGYSGGGYGGGGGGSW